jgi:hypothetical protein
VPYTVVFLAEYAGPMLTYLPFYFFRKEIFQHLGMAGADAPMLLVQTLAMVRPARHCPPRHRMSFPSRNEVSKCVGERGGKERESERGRVICFRAYKEAPGFRPGPGKVRWMTWRAPW